MKDIIFITGYYGSGKTEVAINLAKKFHINYLVDLDIINPYFRSREAKEILAGETEIISSDLKDDMYTDLPFLSKKVFMPMKQKGIKAIYDLGGNDLGAKVLKQFDVKQDFDLFLVINIYRYETNATSKIIELIKRIEEMSGFKITGLINNSNLLDDTTYKEVLNGEKLIEEVSEKLSIPIIFTCISEHVKDLDIEVKGEILSIKTYLRKDWF